MGWQDGQPSDPDLVLTDDHDRTSNQVGNERREICVQHLSQRFSRSTRMPSQQDDGGPAGSCARKDAPEVGVGGDQDSLLPDSMCEHYLVSRRRESHSPDMLDIMICQERHQSWRQIVVEQESHAGARSGACRCRASSAA